MMKTEMLRNMVAGRWRYILSSLAPALGAAMDMADRRKNAHVDCPMPGHGESGKRDFRMFPDYAESGGAVCTCGTYSDGFSLLRRYHGWTFPEVKEQVQLLMVGRQADPPPRREPIQATPDDVEAQREKDQAILQRTKQAWETAIPLSDPRAEVAWWYLQSRHVSPRSVLAFQSLRLHPAMAYDDDDCVFQGNFPVILGCYFNPAGRPITLHRTYLTANGAKLPVDKPKKVMKLPSCFKLAGGAIRLGDPGRVLGVAEGIETALSAHLVTRQPVWSCYCAHGIETFEPPKGVEEVWIWADHDKSRTGITAAKALKARLWGKGIRARILMPPVPIPTDEKSVDWNDVLRMQGALGFPAAKRFMPMHPLRAHAGGKAS
jgi:hypothetical protein